MQIKTKDIITKLETIDDLENITKETLDKIKSLELSGRDYNNDVQMIDFNDLKLFPNLKNLSIEYFTINNNCLRIIKEFEFKNLSFTACEFDLDADSFSAVNTENIYISNCHNFDISFLKNKVFNKVKISTETIEDTININTNKLNLEHCEIKNPEVLRNLNIKELIISTLQYEENPSIYDSFGYKVTVMEQDSKFIYTKVGDNNEC